MVKNAIIVQHDPENVKRLENIFQGLDYHTEFDSNLNHIQNGFSPHSPADVFVIDVQMLGQEWISRTLQLKEKVPNQILLTSNQTTSTSTIEIIEYQRMGVIRTPFNKHQFELALEDGQNEAKIDTEDPLSANRSIRLPIRAKITFPYILLALILAIAAGYLVTRVVFDTIQERFINQLVETGKISSEWMVKEEDRMLETLRLIANQKNIDEFVLEGNAENLREMTFPIAVNSQEEAVEILDLNGQSILSMHHITNGNLEEYSFTLGEDTFKEWAFVSEILSGNSDTYGDKYAGAVSTPWGEYFYVSGPILNMEGELVGVILIGKTLDTIVKQIRSATLGQISLYGFDGNILSSTFLEPQPVQFEMVSDVVNKQDSESLRRDLSVIDIDYSELIGPWEARHDVDFGLIGVALPQNLFVQISSTSRWQIIGIISGAFLFVIAIGIFTADSITRPLLQVIRASSEVARGNLNVKLETTSNDEVRTLTQTFNIMVGELEKSNVEILEAYDSSLEGWSRALELRDYDTDEHSRRVVVLTMVLAEMLGVNEADLIHVKRGAMLHDIGKMGIPDSILLKPGKLDEQEWQMMRKHPQFAYEMLMPIKYLRPAVDIPYCHHEKWDGTGYPNGLKGEEIPLAARIFSVVDVYDALTSDRPYRKAWSPQQALDYIISQKDTHFDPQVVEALEEVLAEGLVGEDLGSIRI